MNDLPLRHRVTPQGPMFKASNTAHLEHWERETVSMPRKWKYQNGKEFWTEHVHEPTLCGWKFAMSYAYTPTWDGNPVPCVVMWIFLSDIL